jgi:hypothetical protein
VCPALPHLQAVSLHEGRPRETLDLIASSYRKGRSARRQLLLEARPRPGASSPATQGVRLPSDYDSKCVDRAAAAEAAAAIAAEAASRGGGEGLVRRRYCPPASTEADSYTIIKFHPLEDSMLHAGECCWWRRLVSWRWHWQLASCHTKRVDGK